MDEGSSDYDVSPRLLAAARALGMSEVQARWKLIFLNRAWRRLRAALTRAPRLGIILALSVASVLGLAWIVGRLPALPPPRTPPGLREVPGVQEVPGAPLARGDAAEVVPFTADDRETLRHAVVEWIGAENGAPAAVRYTVAPRAGADMDAALEILVRYGHLAPGTYAYENPLAGIPEQRWSVGTEGDRFIPIRKERTISFDLSRAHLTLLRGANIRSGGLDIKRPYGNMYCFYIDMASLLGEPGPADGQYCEDQFSRSQIAHYDALHQSMVYALQAYLIHAELSPGLYGRAERGYGAWQPLESEQRR